MAITANTITGEETRPPQRYHVTLGGLVLMVVTTGLLFEALPAIRVWIQLSNDELNGLTGFAT